MAVDKNMPILVVDDYNTMLRILENLLKQLGFHNVDQATDGAEALQKLNATNFDFIISDWNMEPMTGIELLRKVRTSDNLKHIPFIMITAESKTENVIAAQQAGVSKGRNSRRGPRDCQHGRRDDHEAGSRGRP